ncbi:MAG: SDR family NAD(P)-dependent oxidoreductase [Myxococcales bacterium]|nr:SDR family NAD(P)-dependent oxidoreductase [Myxococcales bacterium]
MSGTYLVTGATSGIGAAVADELARRGQGLVLVGRDESSLQARREALVGLGAARVVSRVADLASVARTRALAEELRAVPIAGLLLGAGVIEVTRKMTDEGLELNYAVNHLHKFVLVEALGPRLAQSGGRVVLGAPVGSVTSKLDDVHGLSWSMFKGVSTSQFANDVLAEALPRRLPGLEVIAWNPGSTRGTRVSRTLPWWGRALFWLVNLRGRDLLEVGVQGADLLMIRQDQPLTWVLGQRSVSSPHADGLEAQAEHLWSINNAILDSRGESARREPPRRR